MRLKLGYFVFLLFFSAAFPQQGTYLKLIGIGYASRIIVDNDGNYLISGTWQPNPQQAGWILTLTKLTSSGDSIFQKLSPNAPGEYAYGRELLQTKGGSYLVSAQILIPLPFGNYLSDIGLVKFGRMGDSIFYRKYDINQARTEWVLDMLPLTDSTVFILGVNGNTSAPFSTSFLILDTNGNVHREKIFPSTLNLSSAFKYDNETIYIIGDEDTLVGSTHYRRLIILKTNLNGDSLGTIALTPAHRSGGMGAVIRMADGFFALGTTYWDSLNIKKAVFRKIDAQGRMIWEWETLADNWRTTTMAPAPDTSIVLLQVTQSSKRQIRLSKINKNGALAWQRVIQFPSYVEYGEYASLAVAPDGFILVVGLIRTLWEQKIMLLKTTSEGYVNVGVEDEEGYQPQRFSLEQNYPNPFNPVTSIRYTTSSPTLLLQKSTGSFGEKGGASPSLYQGEGFRVRLSVYDILGREVATLVDEEKAPGTYTVMFNAAQLPSGTYFYELRAGAFRQVRKMVILK